MSPPIIHVRDIPEDGMTVETPLSATWLGKELEGTAIEPARDPAGKASVRLDLQERDVLLTGTVEVAVRMECVRCLEPVPIDLRADFALTLRPRPTTAERAAKARGEVELASEELDEDCYDNDRVDLGRWIREQILLEAPAFPSCPAGCTVIQSLPTRQDPASSPSSSSRESSAIDPRLAPLSKLSKKE